jgi:hypothetical protein
MAILIGNKRCSQLIQLTAAEVQPDDLFYIVDTSARESKKISADQLISYLNMSGSLYALYSVNSDTASFILGSGVFGAVSSSLTSSFTTNAMSSSWSANALSSSWSTTCSFSLNGEIGDAQTASFLKYQGVFNGTASYALSSSVVINAFTASFLQYNIGENNGTSSYSIRTQNVDRAITADTASYFNATIGSVAHANEADHSTTSDYSLTSETASYLQYSPNNGTASYAIKAGTSAGGRSDFGVFLAITQSNQSSALDDVNVNYSLNTTATTTVEAHGTVVVSFTSSIPVSETMTLAVKSRETGIETTFDTIPIYFNLSPIVGDWNTLASGSIKIPFTLLGQSDLFGHYKVYVTASSNVINIEPSRLVRFNISSESDAVSVNVGDTMQFLVNPSSSLLYFSSSLNGPFYDYLPGLYSTGSSQITVMNLSGSNIDTIKYVWSLNNLRELVVNDNLSLITLEGMPNSLSTMSCYSCSLEEIYDMNNIPTMSYLLCNDNNLSALPKLPVSLSYLDCQRNFISTLPSLMPGGLNYLYCGNNQITELPTGISASSLNVLMAENNSFTTIPVGFIFPPLLYTMSFADNPYLTNIYPNWPVSMSYLNIDRCGVYDIPSMPESASYISAYSSALGSSAIESMATELVSNGLSNGYLDIRGTGIPNTNTSIQIGTLIVRSWAVLYDS